MMLSNMGRWISGGIVLPALLVVAGCSGEKPPAEERSVEENLSDTRPIVPPLAPVPAAPPAPIQTETPRIPPPAEPPSADAQMQDDAAASGMTSQITDTDENAPPPASENSN